MADTQDRGRQHRERLRTQGLRPIEIWVPDVHSAEFATQAHLQSAAVAASPSAKEEQDFVDAISEFKV